MTRKEIQEEFNKMPKEAKELALKVFGDGLLEILDNCEEKDKIMLADYAIKTAKNNYGR